MRVLFQLDSIRVIQGFEWAVILVLAYICNIIFSLDVSKVCLNPYGHPKKSRFFEVQAIDAFGLAQLVLVTVFTSQECELQVQARAMKGWASLTRHSYGNPGNLNRLTHLTIKEVGKWQAQTSVDEIYSHSTTPVVLLRRYLSQAPIA